MPSLSVRKLDATVYERLRIRAATHGISMEEEVRQIISHAVAAPSQISAVFRKHFGYQNGIDLKVPNQRKPHDPLDFDK